MDELKIGDVIRVTEVTEDDDDTSLMVGDMGVIKALTLGYDTVDVDLFDSIIIDDERANNLKYDGTYILYTSQIEVVDVPKAGDKILIVESNNRYSHSCDINSLVEVTSVYVEVDEVMVRKNNGVGQVIAFDDFKTIPFQVGDKVVCNQLEPHRKYYSVIDEMITKDEILTIDTIYYNHEYGLSYQVEENCYDYVPEWLSPISQLEKSSIIEDVNEYGTSEPSSLNLTTVIEIKRVGEIKELLLEEGFNHSESMDLILRYFIHQL